MLVKNKWDVLSFNINKILIQNSGSMTKFKLFKFSTVETKSQTKNEEILKDIPSLSHFLTDNFKRVHNYLRISLTERCNLRCQVGVS